MLTSEKWWDVIIQPGGLSTYPIQGMEVLEPNHAHYADIIVCYKYDSNSFTQVYWPTGKNNLYIWLCFIIVAPNGGANYRVVGSVCLSLCLPVAHFFLDMEWPRKLVFSNMTGYRSGKKPVDLGLIGKF